MSTLEYKPHSQTVYKRHLKIMKGCITCNQPSQLAVSFGARRRKFLRVKGVKITDEFAGKANETGNSKLCFHPNDSHRFEFSLFKVVLVHKYLQSKNGRNLGRSRDLRHGKCAIS